MQTLGFLRYVIKQIMVLTMSFVKAMKGISKQVLLYHSTKTFWNLKKTTGKQQSCWFLKGTFWWNLQEKTNCKKGTNVEFWQEFPLESQ